MDLSSPIFSDISRVPIYFPIGISEIISNAVTPWIIRVVLLYFLVKSFEVIIVILFLIFKTRRYKACLVSTCFSPNQKSAKKGTWNLQQ